MRSPYDLSQDGGHRLRALRGESLSDAERRELQEAVASSLADRFAKLERELAETKTLAAFGLACLMEHREALGDLDGGWVQDKAAELGLLVRVEVTEPCGENCWCAEWCDFPQECLRYSEAVQRAITGKEGA